MIFDDAPCELGEGALWHPERQALFWFDILNRRLHMKGAAERRDWHLPEIASAAGIMSSRHLLVASESGLWRFDIDAPPGRGLGERLVEVEAADPGTRSNDGRADRQGGFWIGTMGKRGLNDPGRGAIWRYHRGELRRLFAGLTIPNAISFAPDGSTAYFTDTPSRKIWRVALDAAGWPKGAPSLFLDLTDQPFYPDGATVAADGSFWNAQWGAGRVAAYAPDGQFLRAVACPGAVQTSCPAFGGPDLTTLFVTTAQEGMDAAALQANPRAGQTFAWPGIARGLAEPVIL